MRPHHNVSLFAMKAYKKKKKTKALHQLNARLRGSHGNGGGGEETQPPLWKPFNRIFLQGNKSGTNLLLKAFTHFHASV